MKPPTPRDVELLVRLALAEQYDPPGLAESSATSNELRTIYHHTARRLVDAGFATDEERDRYDRPLLRITPAGRQAVADHTIPTTEENPSC